MKKGDLPKNAKIIDTKETCSVEGCDRVRQHLGLYRREGDIFYLNHRNLCHHHHFLEIAIRYLTENNLQVTGNEEEDIARYHRYSHEYRWYLEEVGYCENAKGNRKGFLNFDCTATFPELTGSRRFLFYDVDHKDGNPSNNKRENLQTLCKCCHAYKTIINGDGQTKGRKKIKEESKKCA